MNDCTDCKLHLQRRNQVEGEGPTNPEYMIIGEAPGREEDRSGRPFCNEEGAGRIANSLLHNTGLKRKDIYITNIIQCRPPNNRDPEPDEIIACRKRLIERVTLVSPKKLIAFGNISTFALTKLNTADWRGMIVTASSAFGYRPTLITYHPAYTMHNRVAYPMIAQDLLKIQQEWDLFPPPPKYWINPDPFTVKTIFHNWESIPVGVDIETFGDKESDDPGLNPWTDHIIGIAFSGEEGIALHLSGGALQRDWEMVKEFLENHPYLIYQNNLFDRGFLKAKGIESPCRRDSMTNMYQIYSPFPRKLQFLRTLYTNVHPYKQKRSKAALKSGDSVTPLENCIDADITRTIAVKQELFLEPVALADRFMRNDNVALAMRHRGVYINQETLTKHYLRLLPQKEAYAQDFLAKYGLNINSSKQMAELVYKRFNFVKPFRAKGLTEEATLQMLLDKCLDKSAITIGLLDLLAYRKLQKKTSTYCEGVFKKIQSDNRLHPDWKTIGTDTTRWACRAPNMMNFPKDMRDMVEATAGKILYGADFKSLELWIAALLSGDEDLLHLLETGVDIHQIALDAIEKDWPLTEKIGPEQARLRAKAVVFGTPGGRSAQSIATEFRVPKATAERWQHSLFKRFPKLTKYFYEYLPAFFSKNGYVETFHGYKRYAERLPQAMNAPMQGTGAEVQYQAMSNLHEAGFNIIISVHDQIVTEEIDDSRYEEFIKIMETSSPEIYPRFPVKGKLGNNWKEVS